MRRTAEQITEATLHLEGLANRRAIFRAYREHDESGLWPICGRFNVTERAIRRVRRLERVCGTLYGLELCYVLDGEISRIVNGE